MKVDYGRFIAVEFSLTLDQLREAVGELDDLRGDSKVTLTEAGGLGHITAQGALA